MIEAIETAKSETRADGQQHSISMGAPEHSRGFSFVSLADADSVDTVFKAAFSIAALKKYAERFDEWFGMGWQLGSSRSVDVAVALKFGWQRDEKMDAAVQQFLRVGRKIVL